MRFNQRIVRNVRGMERVSLKPLNRRMHRWESVTKMDVE